MKVKIKRMDHYLGDSLPSYESQGASGMDVRAQLGAGGAVSIEPGCIQVIPTGIKVEIPQGYEIQVRPRSGWAIKRGLTVVNAPGTIDSDYRGEILVGLINLSNQVQTLHDQDRIAQLVLCPVVKCEWVTADEGLSETERGEGRFGSTGFTDTLKQA